MIGRVLNAFLLLMRVQWRSFFPHVYLVNAVLTIAVIRFAIPPEYWSVALPVVLFAEPGVLGLMLVAAQSFYERSERSTTALAVTPLGSGEYAVALVLTSSALAMGFGLVVLLGVHGLEPRLVRLVLPLLLMTLMMGFIGLALSTYFREFTRFLIGGAVPAMVLLQTPLLTYFGALPRLGLVWVPTDPGLFAIDLAVSVSPSMAHYTLYCGLLAVYAFAAFLWARWAFQHLVRERLESL